MFDGSVFLSFKVLNKAKKKISFSIFSTFNENALMSL